jgi:uncharacterized protein
MPGMTWVSALVLIMGVAGNEIQVSEFNSWSSEAMPNLNEIQAQIQALKPVLQATYQVDRVGIFGSYVRGEQTSSSDLDVLVEFLPDARFGLTKFCELEEYLGDALGLKVDLVMKTGLKPHIGDRILREVVYL